MPYVMNLATLDWQSWFHPSGVGACVRMFGGLRFVTREYSLGSLARAVDQQTCWGQGLRPVQARGELGPLGTNIMYGKGLLPAFTGWAASLGETRVARASV